MSRTLKVAASSLVLVVISGAISLAANVSIPATEVSATGVVYPFVTDRDWLPTDTLDIHASGLTVTLLGCEIQLNAAGIIAFDAGGTLVGNVDALVYAYAEGAHGGALILGNQPLLDGDRPWIQLIRPTAETGLGSNPVPSNVSSIRTLADYGGFLSSVVPAGTTLYLATADNNHSDNSRSYLVSTIVPEPISFAYVLVVLVLNSFRRAARTF